MSLAIGLNTLTFNIFPNLPNIPRRLVPSSFVVPNNHSLKLSFCASIAVPNPKRAPPIGPATPSDNPKIPELVSVPIVTAPANPPRPNIPAVLASDFFTDTPNFPNMFFTVFTNPSLPASSSPNKNLLNMSDFIINELARPVIAPARGPPTKVPNIPPPVIAPVIEPRAVPPIKNFLLALINS